MTQRTFESWVALVGDLFAEDTYGHYREHFAHIRAWRTALGGG